MSIVMSASVKAVFQPMPGVGISRLNIEPVFKCFGRGSNDMSNLYSRVVSKAEKVVSLQQMPSDRWDAENLLSQYRNLKDISRLVEHGVGHSERRLKGTDFGRFDRLRLFVDQLVGAVFYLGDQFRGMLDTTLSKSAEFPVADSSVVHEVALHMLESGLSALEFRIMRSAEDFYRSAKLHAPELVEPEEKGVKKAIKEVEDDIDRDIDAYARRRFAAFGIMTNSRSDAFYRLEFWKMNSGKSDNNRFYKRTRQILRDSQPDLGRMAKKLLTENR